MVDLVYLEKEIDEIKADMAQIKQDLKESTNARFEIEVELAEVKSDVKHVKHTVDTMSSSINRLVLIVLGGVVSSILAFLFTT